MAGQLESADFDRSCRFFSHGMGAADDLSLRLLLTEQVVAELFGDLSPKYTGADLVARFTARFPTHRPVPGGKKLRPFGKTGRRLRQAADNICFFDRSTTRSRRTGASGSPTSARSTCALGRCRSSCSWARGCGQPTGCRRPGRRCAARAAAAGAEKWGKLLKKKGIS